MFKRSLLTISLIAGLSGCVLDGDDGIAGVQGETGEQGSTGEAGQNAQSALKVSLIGRGVLNAQSPEGAAEIVAYHAQRQWIYAINSSGEQAVIDILPATSFAKEALTPNAQGVVTTTNLASVMTLMLNEHTPGDANSIAIDENAHLLAVAMAAKVTGENGHIAFYDISGDAPSFIKNVAVGALPDMVTFSHDGKKIVVANEGEPAGDYSVDPEGSISIIDVTGGVIADAATGLNFQAYNDKQAEL